MMLDYYGIDIMLIVVYSQLSTNCQILGYSQTITNQAAVCELVIIFRPTHNVTYCNIVLGPENLSDMMS